MLTNKVAYIIVDLPSELHSTRCSDNVSVRYAIFIRRVFMTSARRYCDPSCLFVGWLVGSFVRWFVNIRAPTAMTGGLQAKGRTVLRTDGVVRAWRKLLSKVSK